MRFERRPPPIPKDGEFRKRYVFAWRKTIVGNYIVWLEFFGVDEKWFSPAGGGPGWWSEQRRYVLEPAE